MILPIEKWLNEQEFKEDINNLFIESITCYKASAYRAALLFSVLGFQSIIKERILNSEKPTNLKDQKWSAINKNLRKDDSWDKEVNECIKRNDENSRIFDITEDLRQQAAYWKNRRNDCAHSKQNIIDYSHVEAFWQFLKSNLPKFVVNGGVDSLLQKIDRHFNPDFTSLKADYSKLLKEVPLILNNDEDIDKLIQGIYKVFIKYDGLHPISPNERELSFYNELIKLSRVSQSVVDLIKQRGALGLEAQFLYDYPQSITLFYHSEESVRNFWRTNLIKMGYRKFKILAALLRNGLIDNEKEEALEFFIKNISNEKFTEDVNVISELKKSGYFDYYKKIVFEDSLIREFDWANRARHSIDEHLNVIGLDDVVCKSINRVFSSSFYPFKMQETLQMYFLDESKRTEYINVCSSLGIEPTSNLGF
ncbi:hypothetical protein P9E06_20400 [Bacillus mojavensis]|uniref:hypothetical protein n=1 Tax=Bacillus mojavensis TaxID=72360 RepID=UPI002DB717A9|nr:hypothetical protein [Bacillus mojavensis]MEC1680163.1 hypothetical protein [Bacillus mojavensis]MEC1714147.1 hypothetical protein [Bacillus mojavensis]